MLLSPVMKWYVKWPGAVLREEDRATSRQSEVCLTASCSKIKEIWVHLLIWNENLVTICWLHVKNSISEHMTDKFFLVTGPPLETSASPLAPKLKVIKPLLEVTCAVHVSLSERRCPPTYGCMFSLRCQYGLARDASGCEICSCYEPCKV